MYAPTTCLTASGRTSLIAALARECTARGDPHVKRARLKRCSLSTARKQYKHRSDASMGAVLLPRQPACHALHLCMQCVCLFTHAQPHSPKNLTCTALGFRLGQHACPGLLANTFELHRGLWCIGMCTEHGWETCMFRHGSPHIECVSPAWSQPWSPACALSCMPRASCMPRKHHHMRAMHGACAACGDTNTQHGTGMALREQRLWASKRALRPQTPRVNACAAWQADGHVATPSK